MSGGVNIGKSFTGRSADVEPEPAERLLSDASDAFGLIDRLIEEEKIDCFWEKPGRSVGASTKNHFDARRRGGSPYSIRRRGPARTWCPATGSARKSPATIIAAAWSSRAPANCTRRTITRGCSGLPPAWCSRLRQSSGHGHPPERRRMAGRNRPWGGFRRRCGHRENGYTGGLTPVLRRRVVPVAATLSRARICRRISPILDPEGADLVRHRAGAVLLPGVA